MSKSGQSLAFEYTSDGYRFYKEVASGGVTTGYYYYYRDGLLKGVRSDSDVIYIFYDGSGSPVSITHNGTLYYYVKNAQGDIAGITNSAGTLVVSYTYDAWGKPLSVSGSAATTVGTANPLRYRGYVYDTETGLYYLGSRYYDPNVGRFICSDEFLNVGQTGKFNSYNLFAYCNNNAVNNTDVNGEEGISFSIITVIAVCAVAVMSINMYLASPAGQRGIQEMSTCISESSRKVKNAVIQKQIA